MAVFAALDIGGTKIAGGLVCGDGTLLFRTERYKGCAQALAAGIAATATLVDLEAAVIGGGVAQAGELLFTPLWQHLTRYAALPYVHGLRLHPAQLGQDAGLVGAAAHARGMTAQTVE